MAQKVLVELVDDLDGTSGSDIETVHFALDGVVYEIDLTEKNSFKLRDSMADFVAKARRTNGRAKRSAPTTKGTSHNKEQSRAIRLWAKANGHDLADRGRIPASVVEAFELAHR